MAIVYSIVTIPEVLCNFTRLERRQTNLNEKCGNTFTAVLFTLVLNFLEMKLEEEERGLPRLLHLPFILSNSINKYEAIAYCKCYMKNWSFLLPSSVSASLDTTATATCFKFLYENWQTFKSLLLCILFKSSFLLSRPFTFLALPPPFLSFPILVLHGGDERI